MDLEVTFLGTGASVPSARRSTAAVLIARGGDRLLFDCGEGTQRQMQRSLGLVQVDEIYLTHFHADHMLGLPGLLKTYDLHDREAPLRVFGPPGLKELFTMARERPGTLNWASTTGATDTTHVSGQDYWGNSGKYVAAEGFILDASWFRIREASLSYRIPLAVYHKSPFTHIDVSVYGRNLFLHAPNYPHLDPEQNALGISNAVGLEFNALPQTRSIGASLKFGL